MEKFTAHIEDWEVEGLKQHREVSYWPYFKSIAIMGLVASLLLAASSNPVQSATSSDLVPLYDSKVDRKLVDRKTSPYFIP